MPTHPAWSRRAFLQTLVSTSAFGSLASLAPWASGKTLEGARLASSPRLVFVASEENEIHVFSVAQDGVWHQRQTVSSSSPASLALSPDQCFLYVANAVDSFDHLPTSSVEAYVINKHTGDLTLLNRQPLALSATMAKHLAVSPDGSQLAVAVDGGAAYNLLPINRDGSLARVTASLKQVGRGSRPQSQTRARPQAVFFRDNERLLGLDAGSDRISAFTIERDGALTLQQHQAATAGSGPGHIVACPRENLYYIAGTLDATISSIHYSAGAESPLRPVEHLRMPGVRGGISALAKDCCGSHLFAADADGISIVRIGSSGAISYAGRQTGDLAGAVALACSLDGRSLFAVGGRSGSVMSFAVDQEHAQLSSPVEHALINKPVAIALKHA